MTGDWVYWIGWVGMAALYAVMIYIAWRALFHDRGKHKRRCPKCWHDLSHTPGMTCGECGYTAYQEAQLHKTRRKPVLAIGAISVCLLATAFINHQMDQRGWAGIMPTNVLIWTLPLSIDGQTFNQSELNRRMNQSELSERQWLAVLNRCAEGDWWREPVDDDWLDTYGRILEQWGRTLSRNAVATVAAQGDTGVLNRELLFRQQVREILLTIPPRVEATTRPDWPDDAPSRVEVSLEQWWPRDYESRLKLKPVIENAVETTAYRGGRFAGDLPFSLQLPAGAQVTEIDVTVERRGRDEQWTAVHQASVPINIIDAPPMETVMEPVAYDALDDALRSAFDNGVVRWGGGMSPVRFRVNVPATIRAEFEGVAIGVKVELQYKDELARRLDLWWLAGLADDRHYNFEIAYENLALLNSLDEDSQNWTLTVTGDESIAHRAGPASKYWNNTVELPVVVTVQDGESPPRPWWTDEQVEETTPQPEAVE